MAEILQSANVREPLALETQEKSVNRKSNSSDLPNLDVLRSIAVLTVVLAHTLQRFYGLRPFLYPLGNAAVLIFFVHTTLVLLMSMERSGKDGFDLVRDFYIRRLFRIYPLSVLTVIAVTLWKIPDRPWVSYSWIGWKGIGADLLLISNITKTPEASAPLWSLPYEVQMYLVLPSLYLFARKASTRSKVFLIAGSATAVAIFVHTTGSLALIYVPCFMAGILAFHKRDVRHPAILGLGFLLAWIAIFALTATTAISTEAATGWIACPILATAIPWFRQTSNPLVQRTAKFIAQHSYGIYLTHMPLLWVCFVCLRASHLLQGLAFLTLALVLPMALFRFIERPMIDLGRGLAR